jgi:hypothetical protein
MWKHLVLTGGAIWGMALLGESSAQADTTLLSLTNPAGQTDTPFDLSFMPTAATTTLSVEGYQHPSNELVTDNSVMLSGGGPNLLGMTWTFIPAASGSFASQDSDGTGVNSLLFQGVGSFDTFTQTFATTPGDVYTYSFLFSNGIDNGLSAPSGFMVVVTSASAVPEPSTWAMMLLGFAGLGFAGYSRSKKHQRAIPAT